MEKMDKSVINLKNKVNVLEVLRQNDSIFKAEIARLTNLSVPTVMKLIDELAEKKLVNEVGKGISSGGKPPMLLQFNKDAYYVIGVDINEYRTEVVLVNLLLGVEDKRIQDIRTTDTPKTVIERIVKEIHYLLKGNLDKAGKILGIGIAVPGMIEAKSGVIVYSSEMNWQGVNMREELQEVFDGEIVIEESTRAMAMAEKMFGRGRNVDNFLCINIGSGIGSALVINGKLYYGGCESAGQLAHLAVERNGSRCNCGNYGCLEQYASAKAIEKAARERTEKDRDTQILDLVYGDLDKINVYIVFEAARNGDRVALEILEEAAQYLGMAVVSIINFLDPEMIILEGKVCRLGEVYMDMFQKVLKKRKMRYLGRRIQVVNSSVKNNECSKGAAAFIIERFIARGGEVKSLLTCL